MIRSDRGRGRLRLWALWVAVLSLLSHASPLLADDECERLAANGTTRDCTYLEEVRECVDDTNDSWDDCVDDALNKEGFFSKLVNVVGCEAAWWVNSTACAVEVTSEWALGDHL